VKFFGSFFILIFFTLQLFGAHAYLQNKMLFEGDIATLIIHLEGKNVRIKRLYDIAGMPIVEHGGHSDIKYNNGEKIKDIYYEVKFYPKKSMRIPPLEITLVNGEKQKTNPIDVVVQKNPNPSIIFDALLSNDTPFQNEVIKYTLRLKYNEKFDFQDIKFTQPDFPGLWLEAINFSVPETKGDFIIREVNYYLMPKKIGDIHLSEGTVEVEQQGSEKSKVETTHKREFSSKTVSLKVKELPISTNLVGNFKIETIVDKKEIEGNDMVHLILRVKGEGGFSDIEPFSLELDNATVTTKEPQLQISPEKGLIRGIFIQEFFIGNAKGDFIIPAFTLKAYDFLTKKMKTVQSSPFKIHVNNPIIEKEQRGGQEELPISEKKGFQLYSLNLVIGFFIGVIFILVVQFLIKKKSIIRVLQPKNDKILLQKILPHKGTNQYVDVLIEKLEANLYKKQKAKISHAEIKKVLHYIAAKNSIKKYQKNK
jgi:hypothetical protein